MLVAYSFPADEFVHLYEAVSPILKEQGIVPHQDFGFDDSNVPFSKDEQYPHISVAYRLKDLSEEEKGQVKEQFRDKPSFAPKGWQVFPGGQTDFGYLVLEFEKPIKMKKDQDFLAKTFQAEGMVDKPHCSIIRFPKKQIPQVQKILPMIEKTVDLKSSYVPDHVQFWDKVGGSYEVVSFMEKKNIKESIDEGYKEAKYSGTFYHGSPVDVKIFGLTGDGRLGKGLYLTTEKWADFHAKGGRIGHARNLKDKGFVYEFEVSGDAAIIVNEERFLRSLVGEFEPAEEAYSRTGDLYSKAVSKYISDWAQEYGFDMVVFPGDEGMIVEFPHILVVKEGVAKLKKQVSESFIQDFIDSYYDDEWVPEVLEEAKKKKKKKKKSAQYAFAPFYGRGDGTSGATMPPFRSPTGGPTPKLGPSLPGPTGINAPQFGTLAASAAKFGNLSEEDSELKSIEYLKSLAPELAQAAQKIYNDWDEDDTDTYANGGICHFIADAMVEIMSKHGVDCATVSSSHEQHVYCVAKVEEGVYSVDIHWSYYEAGGGFSWKKIKDVEFDGGMVEFYKITPDPEEFESYIEAW